jgi:hypothetical protein
VPAWHCLLPWLAVVQSPCCVHIHITYATEPPWCHPWVPDQTEQISEPARSSPTWAPAASLGAHGLCITHPSGLKQAGVPGSFIILHAWWQDQFPLSHCGPGSGRCTY